MCFDRVEGIMTFETINVLLKRRHSIVALLHSMAITNGNSIYMNEIRLNLGSFS
jgi:hypothetical protein